MKPRSNSIGLLVGVVLAIAVMITAAQLDRDDSQPLLWRSGFIGFGIVLLSVSIAEYRSGYTWKNLAPGNRGVARVDEPRTFWFSVAGHAAFAGGLLAFGLLATPPEPTTPAQGVPADHRATEQSDLSDVLSAPPLTDRAFAAAVVEHW